MKPFAGVHNNTFQHISMDNHIHKILSIESNVAGEGKTARAYPVINDIIKTAKEKIADEMRPLEKLQKLYWIIREDFDIQYGKRVLLSEGLSKEKKVVNCLAGSYIFIAVAHELGWPVYLATPIGHAFIFWQFSEKECLGFETTNGGQINDDDHNMLKQEAGSIVRNGRNYIFAEAYYNLGVVYHESGKYDLEVGAYTKAIELRPDFSEAYTYRGYAHYELGQREEAKKDSAEEQARNDWATGNALFRSYRFA
jgi:tetratricopeptide (TPR) repeat protein